MSERAYLVMVAQSMIKSDDPENKAFGELLLRVIPEDEAKIPVALINDILIDVDRAASQEAVELQGWGATQWTDEKALGWIGGTPYLDDPPEGWRKRDLAMFARGYAEGRGIQKANDNEALTFVRMTLERIKKRLSEPTSENIAR